MRLATLGPDAELAATLLVAGLTCWLWWRWQQRRQLAYPLPPVVAGWPVIGSLVAFSRGPLAFLDQCRSRFKDIFTIRLPGQRITWVLDPAALDVFFNAPVSQVTFRPAVERFVERVFGCPANVFLDNQAATLAAMRSSLSAPAMASPTGHALRLQTLVDARLDSWPDVHESGLMATSKALLFASAVDLIFGAAFGRRHGHAELSRRFFAFESWFELASSPLPHAFLPDFTASRAWLLAAFAASLAAGDFALPAPYTPHPAASDGPGCPAGPPAPPPPPPAPPTAAASMLGAVVGNRGHLPAFLLALLWASQANTTPAAAWAVAFLSLPESKTRVESIRRDLAARVAGGATPAAAAAAAACDGASLLRRCVTEAVRLRAPAMDLRVAADDVIMAGFTVPKHDLIMISPYVMLQDARLISGDASAYRPERWADRGPGGAGAMRAATTPGVSGVAWQLSSLPFGAGYYRCPGRHFAEAEIAVFVGALLARFEVTLVGEGRGVPSPGDPRGRLPPPDPSRLVGVRVPVRDAAATFTRRARAC